MSAITFPNLGISINPAPVAFTLFGLQIHWYGLIIAVGFLLAVVYMYVRKAQFGLNEDQLLDLLLCVVPVGIICSRIYYCIFDWNSFKDNPISCLYIWEGGLAIYGAVIGGAIAAVIYGKVKKIKIGTLLDISALGVIIGQTVGRWGNFINREVYGVETDAFLKMGLADAAGNVKYYQPLFLYESLWNLLGFVLLHFYSKKRKFDGEVFIAYAAWYGLGRGILEGMRMKEFNLMIPGTQVPVSQVFAFVTCAVAIGLLLYIRLAKKPDGSKLYVNLQKKTENAENL